MAGKKTENRGDAGRRTSRVESEIREVIATYLLGHLRGEVPGMVSVTRVIVSKDLRQAKVLITVMDPTGETGLTGKALHDGAVDALQDHAYLIQEDIDHKLRMRFTPKLTFFYDDGFDHALKVENILHEIAQKRSPEASQKPSTDGHDPESED